MEMGTSHRVVWYSVVQKMTEPETDHYLDSSTTRNLIIFNVNENLIIKIVRKSVRQVLMKGDYIVTGCPLHTKTPSQCVLLRKTFNPARTNWEGILGESRVERE